MGLSFFDFSNFYKLRREDLISRTNFAESLTYLVPLVYFKFKSFADLEVLSFVRFQYILHDSGVLFSESSNFYKLKRGDLISGGNQFWRKSEWFGTPFLISILKVLRTKILCQSLHFNAFCPVSGVSFSDFWNFYKLKRGTYFLGRTNFAERLNYFVPPFVFHF